MADESDPGDYSNGGEVEENKLGELYGDSKNQKEQETRQEIAEQEK